VRRLSGMLPHDGNAINNGCVLFTTCRTIFSGRISAAHHARHNMIQ
jgi:hypothetical protein